ncbi:MAG: hypothetical protein O9972_02620, partial [Burkholderiales bacterium]|nr:hypothetical protein [Burkholderiales bacterium]
MSDVSARPPQGGGPWTAGEGATGPPAATPAPSAAPSRAGPAWGTSDPTPPTAAPRSAPPAAVGHGATPPGTDRRPQKGRTAGAGRGG